MNSIDELNNTLLENGSEIIHFLYLNPVLEDYYEHLKLLERTLSNPNTKKQVQKKIEVEENDRRLLREAGPYKKLFRKLSVNPLLISTTIFIGDIEKAPELRSLKEKSGVLIVFKFDEVENHLKKRGSMSIESKIYEFAFKKSGVAAGEIPKKILEFISLYQDLKEIFVLEIYDNVPIPQPILLFKEYYTKKIGYIKLYSIRSDILEYLVELASSLYLRAEHSEDGLRLYLTETGTKKLEELKKKEQGKKQ